MAESLFITRNDIVKFTALNGNVDTDKFIQFIKIAQDIHIQNYLGSKLFQKLQADVASNTGAASSIQLVNGGTGYTTGYKFVTGGSGTGLQINVTGTSGGAITNASINIAGTGYVVGDVVTLLGGTGGQYRITGDDIPTNYRNLLVNFVKPMLIHWGMVEYLPFAAYTIANKGIYKHTSENAENVDKNEVDYLLEKERSIAQHYTERFIEYMSFNQTLFPEYRANKNNDMFPDSMNNYTGWYI
jgi:hypothetical protein